MQQTSTFLKDSVSTTSQTLPLRVLTLSVPTLNFLRCLLDSPQWPHPASHTWQEAKLETLPTELSYLLAPPISDSTVVLATKDFGTTVFMGSPVLTDVPIQFFNGIWACTPFPHSGSVLCRCPYKERIVCQTTIARTPSHRSVDDCCLALPPRLWQPRNPEGREATVIEGSLTFPHSCWVSQLNAVLRHTQDICPNLQRSITHEIFFRIYSKVNQAIYSSLLINSKSFKALASTVFEIFCWQEKNAQNYKGP